MTDSQINPALVQWDGPFGLPRFPAVSDADFAPAFDEALKAHVAEIERIAGQGEPPTFANTVEALETAGQTLGRVSALFWNRAGADTNPVIQAVERDIAPRLSRHWSTIGTNMALFARIDRLWQDRAALGLSLEQTRVLERHWKGFVKSGARLPKDEQDRLAAIHERLAGLKTAFGQNVLADEEQWVLFLLEEGDLAGLPAWLTAAMAAEAARRGRGEAHALTLNRSLVEPFLTFSSRRDLRERAFKAWIARGEADPDRDNRPIIKEILALRAEAAALLGYSHHAALILDDSMAKTPDAVNGLLMDVWTRAREAALREEADLTALAAEEGFNGRFEAWDWRYYAEKLRARRFAFSEAELKPYLQLDRMVAACFDVAERLFGLVIEAQPEVPVYHPDARVFTVRDRSGDLKALFIGDYFARPSKRSGAWMSSFQTQHKLDGGRLPIIYNVCNFAQPAPGEPALLSLDDARTLFHEFGHALHGMLSDVTYPSVSGTSVSRDFVELPSQLYEHWFTVPAVLERYAVHAETGEPMPKALLDKVLAARTYGSGFATVEFTASALVDMALHTRGAVEDPVAVEAEILQSIGMPETIVMRHRSTHFGHIFSGGYSAGYYSYMWSEVLDADAFAAFREAGDPFDAATAEKLRAHVYASGGSVDPEAAYVAFRGRLPSPEAMLVKKGLVAA